MVRLCQAALRRTGTCAALPRPLHPPHGHLQPPHHRLRRRTRQLPLARLCARRQAARHDPRRRQLPAAASSCMCCPKASCASAAMACSPTASANSCCPWRAPCSPHRAANRCLFRRCLTAIPGTVPVAEKPCASFSASPPHNSISQASILHDHRRQPAPTACSLHVSAAVCAPRSEQLHGYAQSHPRNRRIAIRSCRRTHRCPSSTTKNRPTESLAASPDAIQYP